MKHIVAICLLLSAIIFNGLNARETYLHRIIQKGELHLAYDYLKDKMIRCLCSGAWIYGNCYPDLYSPFLEILTKIHYKLTQNQAAFVKSQEQFGEYLLSSKGILDFIRLIEDTRELLMHGERNVRVKVMEDDKLTNAYFVKNINLSHEEIDYFLDALWHIKEHMDNPQDMQDMYQEVLAAFEHEFYLATNDRDTIDLPDSPLPPQALFDVTLPRFHDSYLMRYVNERDKNGQTVLHLAAGQHASKLVELLIFCGSYRFAQDNEGNTPMHMLIKSCPALLVEHAPNEYKEFCIKSIEPIKDTFLRLCNPERKMADGDPFNIANKEGETALGLLACHSEGSRFIKILLDEEVAIEHSVLESALKEVEKKLRELLRPLNTLSAEDHKLFIRFTTNHKYLKEFLNLFCGRSI